MLIPELVNLPPKLMPALLQFNNYGYFLLEGGRGSGKSNAVARILLYVGDKRKVRIFCGREVQKSIDDSVHALLADLIKDYQLPYEILQSEIRHISNGTVINFKGFREIGVQNVKGLQGVDILWIDEAQSITKKTLDIILPTIRADESKVFFSMNRFLREDPVFLAMENKKDCLRISINYNENPFATNKTKAEAQECLEKSERDYNHIWLGQPLPQADDYLFNFEKLQNAYDVKPFGDFWQRQRAIGIDFAAQGNDLCVATILDRKTNQHWELVEQIGWSEPDTTVSIGKIISICGAFKPDVAILDIGGMGKPVYDRLIECGINIQPFDGASTKGIDIVQAANKRAAGYLLLASWFENNFLCIHRKDREVVNQLEKIRYKYRSNGSKIIQPKLDMKALLKYSPDNADSLMMAVWAATHCMGGSANAIANASKPKIVNSSKKYKPLRRRGV